jgi:branched-chain amino acid aminotransferase
VNELANLVWRNGELIPFAEASIHVLSHAAIRGSEVFDALRVLPGVDGPSAVGLRPHLARFDRSMGLMGMVSPYDVRGLQRAVAQTVLANPGEPDCMVRIMAAWVEVAATTVPAALAPTVFMAVVSSPAGGVVAPEPARLATAPIPKIPAAVLPPSLKVAASYTPGVVHQLAARAAGFDDVVFRASDGALAEAPSQSLLVVAGERLLAPPLDSVLDGVTRRLVLDLAIEADIPVEIRQVDWSEVTGASELILVSSSRFIRSVVALDDIQFPASGPVVTRLGIEVRRLVAGHHRLSGRWLTPLGALVS